MASRIQGITVEIGGDTTKLSKALESVNKSIKGTQSRLKDVNKLLKLDPSNTELVVQKQKMLKSRGAYLMGLTTYGKYEIEDQVNFTVYVPKVDEHFVGSLAVIPLQLLGYYVSVAKGLDVDKPRNLAKSVTVE